MYQNLSRPLCWCAMVGLVGIAVTGCNQGSNVDSPETVAATALTDVVDQEGCCGRCAEAGQGKAAQGCCGKCKAEAASDGSTATGCCSKCQGEQTAAEVEGGCSGNCDACAEGNSANCQCEGEIAVAAGPPKGELGQPNSMREDRDVFHYLLQNHEKIERKVTELDNGVKTVTQSDDAEIVNKLQEHVSSMHRRIEDGRPLRMWDDLYREIFKHNDKIKMEIELTAKGVSVTETSEDEYVVKLIKEHAKVVSGFAKRGFNEARENHPVPKTAK